MVPMQMQEKYDVLLSGQDHYIFTSYKDKTLNIFHNLTCKSYLRECVLYKLQYVGESETPFNLRLNTQRSDI